MIPNRRAFMSAAGAAAVYQLAGAPPEPKRTGPNDALGVGFIGVGIRGSQLMQEFSKIPAARFVAAADLYDGYLQHAREFAEGAFPESKLETTKRYEDILARKDIDAVVIATPDHLHRRMTLDALAAGKHVYIEKPMTWSLKEGPEIIAAEKRSGKVLQVGSGTKTSAMAAKARELVAAKAVGKITQVRMFNHRNSAEGAWVYPIPPDASTKTIDWERFLGPAPKRAFSPEVFFRWRCWWEYSGGVATDLFVHLLTTLHEVFQTPAPVSVVSQGGLWHWKDGRTVPDVLESVFEYPDGFIAQMCVNLKSNAPAPYMTIMGTDGTMVWDRDRIVITEAPQDPNVQLYGTLAWPKALREEYLKQNPRPSISKPEPREIPVERGPGHAEWFIRSIVENQPSKENATEGHAAAGAGHLANMAYRQGRKLKWDFARNKVS